MVDRSAELAIQPRAASWSETLAFVLMVICLLIAPALVYPVFLMKAIGSLQFRDEAVGAGGATVVASTRCSITPSVRTVRLAAEMPPLQPI